MISKSQLGCMVVAIWMLMPAASLRADDDWQEGMFVLGESGGVQPEQSLEAAVVIGGDLVVEGRIRTVAIAVGGDVRLTPTAVVEGSVLAIGGLLEVDEGARVAGARVQVEGGDFSQVVAQLSQAGPGREAPPLWLGPVLRFTQMLALLVLATILVLLAPRPVRRVRDTLLQHAMASALAGLAIMAAFVPLCVLLAVSIFGIPLIPVAVFVLLAGFVMGLTGLASAIGFKLPALKRKDNLLGTMALGILVLMLATVIPVLGGVVLLLSSFYGAGAVLLSRFGVREPPTPESLRPARRIDVTAPAEQP